MCLLALAFLTAAPPLHAWDRDVHLALAKAALGISPAVEEHLPLEHRDALFKDLAEPDYLDKECRYHCADTGGKEAAVVAEQTLAAIVSPKAPLKPYQRAQLVGRYLHYVADAVAPGSLRRENAPKLVNFFANKDFIFFREPRALEAPISAGLRKRAQEMTWANVNEENAYTAMFRLAVNTLADAMMLLPAREGAKAPDGGPVWFLVNRMDTGMAGKATEGHWQKETTSGWKTYTAGGWTVESSGTWTTWNWVAGSKSGGDSFKKLHMMERLGVQLAELSARQEEARVLLRGILFNNGDMCAEEVALKAGKWTWSLPGRMPPHSLRAFEVEAPRDLLSRPISHGFKFAACSEAARPPFLSAKKRVVVGNTSLTPNFDYSTVATDLAAGKNASSTNMTQRN